jgi:hypothetical protein
MTLSRSNGQSILLRIGRCTLPTFYEMVNPSTPRPKGWGLASARAQAEGSGFALSGAFHSVLKNGASRRRTGEP